MRKRRDIWKFVTLISAVCILVSEAFITAMYLIGGSAAMNINNALMLGFIVPIVTAVPITFWVAQLNLRLHLAHKELRVLADTDVLTQLPNRRRFFSAAQPILDVCEGTGQQATLMIIDADHFKDLNDSFGHAAGDEALVAIAKVLQATARHSDLVCRVGGEEFAILLPQTSAQQAESLAQRIVSNVAAAPIVHGKAVIEFSVSCGVADTRTGYDLAMLFKAADDAMYRAKREGRNRVHLQAA